jgi:transcriptional regulator with XRE-family HTH domain
MTPLGRRIKQARERLELSQSDVARLAGMTPAAVSNYEQGINKTVRSVIEFARALRVNPEWLANGIGPMESKGGDAVSPATLELARRIERLTGPQRAVVLSLLETFTEQPAVARKRPHHV